MEASRREYVEVKKKKWSKKFKTRKDSSLARSRSDYFMKIVWNFSKKQEWCVSYGFWS